MGRRRMKFQLYDGLQAAAMRGVILTAAGGVVYVAKNGDAQKQAITDKDGVALSNPLALTQGGAEFHVPDTIDKVDLYIMTPGGQFVRVLNVDEKIADIAVDSSQSQQMAIIPFSIADTAAATETDTGFDFPDNAAVLPWPMVRVTTLDATEDIDVGLLSSGTGGDADGLIDSVSVGTLGLFKASLLTSADTMGALLSVQDSANAGDDAPEVFALTGTQERSITYTLSAGSDTAEGFIYLPYWLCGS